MRKMCPFRPGTAVQVLATDGIRYTGTVIRPTRGSHGRAMVVRLDDKGGAYGGSVSSWESSRIPRAH